MHRFTYAAQGGLLALAASSMACGLGADDESPPETPQDSKQSTVVGCCGASASDPNVDGLRLSLFWNDGGREGAGMTSIWLAPYTSSAISLFDGSSWITRTIDTSTSATVPSLDMGTGDTTYDIFAYWSGTEVRLEAIPWTAGESNVVDMQDGVDVKTNDATRRYVGAVATEPTGGVYDTYHTRHIWHRYNQTPHKIQTSIPASTYDWSYANPNNAWRPAANDTLGPIRVLVGGKWFRSRSYASITVQSMAYSSTGAGWFATGVGIDDPAVNRAQVGDLALARNWSDGWGHATAYYEDYLLSGKHTIRWLETGSGTSVTYTFLGHSRSSPFGQTGLVGWIMM